MNGSRGWNGAEAGNITDGRCGCAILKASTIAGGPLEWYGGQLSDFEVLQARISGVSSVPRYLIREGGAGRELNTLRRLN